MLTALSTGCAEVDYDAGRELTLEVVVLFSPLQFFKIGVFAANS